LREPQSGDQSFKGAALILTRTQYFELETEMSPTSQAPLSKRHVSQGSQNLALGLAKTAASQLDEFVRGPGFLGKAMKMRFRIMTCPMVE
jgi:hypothetical protein